MLGAALLTVLLVLGATETQDEEPLRLGRAGGVEFSREDLVRHGAREGDETSVGHAIWGIRQEIALAEEAKTLLPGRASGSSQAEGARALLLHLYGPSTCRRIPSAKLKERYTETRWRLVAPPAWRVEDLQLLCCQDARDCERSEVGACLARRSLEASELYGTLGSLTPGPGVLESLARDLRARGRQAARSTYLFYYDPAEPEGRIDGRLQTVDALIARAVSASDEDTWIGPVSTRFGHHFLRLVHRRDAIRLPFDDPRTQALLRTELCPSYLLEQRERYGAELARVQAWSVHREAVSQAFKLQP